MMLKIFASTSEKLADLIPRAIIPTLLLTYSCLLFPYLVIQRNNTLKRQLFRRLDDLSEEFIEKTKFTKKIMSFTSSNVVYPKPA